MWSVVECSKPRCSVIGMRHCSNFCTDGVRCVRRQKVVGTSLAEGAGGAREAGWVKHHGILGVDYGLDDGLGLSQDLEMHGIIVWVILRGVVE
jgi:hypothetical protein